MALHLNVLGMRIRLSRTSGSDVVPLSKDLRDERDPRQKGLFLRKWLEQQFRFEMERVKGYRLYDQMDLTDLAASVLDLYAEDATVHNKDTGRTIWAEGKNNRIVNAIESMIRSVGLEQEASGICRDMAKHGDEFERLIYDSGGVRALFHYEARMVNRVETKYRRVQGFTVEDEKFRGQTSDLSYPYDFVHFRLRGKHRNTAYGTSILHGARRAWRQLTLAEDHLLMLRLQKAPDRHVFFIDVGGAGEAEARRTVKAIERQLRRAEWLDPEDPDYETQYNPFTAMEDLVVPMREGSNTRVEPLSGISNLDQVYDLLYYLDKFFSAVRAPKAYFGFEGDVNGRATLSNQSIRYARGVDRLQRAFIEGCTRMAKIHLSLMRTSMEDAELDYTLPGNEFRLVMEPVSYLAELERLELLQVRADVAAVLQQLGETQSGTYDVLNWTKWIFRKVLALSSDEIDAIARTPPPTLPDGTPNPASNQNGSKPPNPDDLPSTSFDGEDLERIKTRDGELTEEEERTIVSIIQKHPKLRRLMSKGQELFRGRPRYEEEFDEVTKDELPTPSKGHKDDVKEPVYAGART